MSAAALIPGLGLASHGAVMWVRFANGGCLTWGAVPGRWLLDVSDDLDLDEAMGGQYD